MTVCKVMCGYTVCNCWEAVEGERKDVCLLAENIWTCLRGVPSNVDDDDHRDFNTDLMFIIIGIGDIRCHLDPRHVFQVQEVSLVLHAVSVTVWPFQVLWYLKYFFLSPYHKNLLTVWHAHELVIQVSQTSAKIK